MTRRLTNETLNTSPVVASLIIQGVWREGLFMPNFDYSPDRVYEALSKDVHRRITVKGEIIHKPYSLALVSINSGGTDLKDLQRTPEGERRTPILVKQGEQIKLYAFSEREQEWKLTELKNPGFLALEFPAIGAERFLKDSTVLKEDMRTEIAPNMAFGLGYYSYEDFKQLMEREFGNKAPLVAAAYNQPAMGVSVTLLQESIREKFYFVADTTDRSVNFCQEGEQIYLDTEYRNLSILFDAEDVGSRCPISGTIKTRSALTSHGVLNPKTGEEEELYEFKLESVTPSNQLLRKMIMERVNDLTPEDLLEPGIFQEDLLFHIQNSVFQDEEGSPVNLSDEATLKNPKLKNWLETYLQELKQRLQEIVKTDDFSFAVVRNIATYIINAEALLKKISVLSAVAENKIELPQRAKVVRQFFDDMRNREIKGKKSGYIRDQLPGDHLDSFGDFLVEYLINDPYYSSMGDAEFIQLARFSIEEFARSAEENASKIPLSFKEAQKVKYYEGSLLPKIRSAACKIVSDRGRLLADIKELDLAPKKMEEFAMRLGKVASDFWEKSRSCFQSKEDALQSLCKDIFRGCLDGDNELDELFYRLAYLLKHNPGGEARSFIKILWDEAMYLRISRKNGWSVEICDALRQMQAPILKRLSEKNLSNLDTLISRNEEAQNKERQNAFSACWEIVEEGNKLMEKSQENTEDFVAGKVMADLGVKLIRPWNDHYKSHHVCLSRSNYISKSRDNLVNEVEGIIEKEISTRQELTQYGGLGERIKIYIQNIFMTLLSVGIAPLVRKFALNKSAFFPSPREEIIEDLPHRLRAVPSA